MGALYAGNHDGNVSAFGSKCVYMCDDRIRADAEQQRL